MSQKLVALVTGASGGIGRGIAIELGRSGYDLVLSGRNKSKLDETVRICEEHGTGVHGVVSDLGKPKEYKALTAQAFKLFPAIDVLVNNAGIHNEENWENCLDVNLNSLMGLTYEVLPKMKQNGGGAIINIASISGLMGMAGSAAYCASKHGVMGFTRALFEEVRDIGIKVTAICPGYVNTELARSARNDSTRMIQVEDIAYTVKFVLDFPGTGCPTEIVVRPQRSVRIP